MIDNDNSYQCPICNRFHESQKMTWHHLLPAINGKEKVESERIYICKTCHPVIHFCHTNIELRTIYNSIETIIESQKILEFIELYKYRKDNIIFSLKKLRKILEEHDGRLQKQSKRIA